MIAMSLPQVALALIVLIGGPILCITIVRAGLDDDLARPLKFLHAGFWGAVLSFAFAMSTPKLLAATAVPPAVGGVASNVLASAFYVFGCFYWTSLGVLAHRTRRSTVLWIVVGLATLAIGFVVSYIAMATKVHNELASRGNGLATESPR